MEKTFAKLLVAITATALLAGCSGYNKLLKSKDYDKMYKKALEYYDAKKYQRTIQLLDEVSPMYINVGGRMDTIAFYQASAYYKMGDFETSGSLLNDYRRAFGNSPFIEEAEYMYAKGFYYSSPAPNRDQTATKQALIAINEYLQRYPNSVKKEVMEDNIRELTEKLHDKVYINAKLYYTIGKYKSAVVALKNTLSEYPDSRHREEILYLIVKSGYELAANSIREKQRDRYLDMMDYYYNMVSEYPESKYTKELNKMQENAKKYLARTDDGTGDNIDNEDNENIIDPNGSQEK